MDHLSGVGAHNDDTEQLVGLLIGNDLDHAFGALHDTGTAIGHEGELANLVVDALLLGLILTEADHSDFGVGVADGRDGGVVHVTHLAGDVLDACDSILLGLVGKHRTMDNVSDGVDTLDIGLEVFVDLNASALINADANSIRAKPSEVGTTTDGDEADIALDFRNLTALGGLGGELHNTVDNLTLGHLGAELEGETLLLKAALEAAADFRIQSGHNVVEELNDSDFSTKTLVDAAHLKADVSGANDDEALRNFLKSEGTGRRDDLLLVDGDTRKRGDLRTSSQKNVLSLKSGAGAVIKSDLDFVGALHLAPTLNVLDLVLLKESLNTLSKIINGSVLLVLHLGEID
mmetsp:Transcript_18098/g.33046  ORF Transcript_18098/g.33046 Transcript_18098/m.33046 type:complete len:347 (-) Transcript_18098:429-1469(-)